MSRVGTINNGKHIHVKPKDPVNNSSFQSSIAKQRANINPSRPANAPKTSHAVASSSRSAPNAARHLAGEYSAPKSQFYKIMPEGTAVDHALIDDTHYGYATIKTLAHPDGEVRLLRYFTPQDNAITEPDAPNDSPTNIPFNIDIWANEPQAAPPIRNARTANPSARRTQSPADSAIDLTFDNTTASNSSIRSPTRKRLTKSPPQSRQNSSNTLAEPTLRGGNAPSPSSKNKLLTYAKEHPSKSIMLALGVLTATLGISIGAAQAVQEVKKDNEDERDAAKKTTKGSAFPNGIEPTTKKEPQKQGPINPWTDRLSKYT